MGVRNILIIGLGGVGLHLARRLVDEGYNITIIESNPQLISSAQAELDAKIIDGNAMELSCWKRAGAESIDLMIAVTDQDSVNMIASIIADRFGIKGKIARVRSRNTATKTHSSTKTISRSTWSSIPRSLCRRKSPCW